MSPFVVSKERSDNTASEDSEIEEWDEEGEEGEEEEKRVKGPLMRTSNLDESSRL